MTVSRADLPPGAIGAVDTQVLLHQVERRHLGHRPLHLPELAERLCVGKVRAHTALRRLQAEGLVVPTSPRQRGAFAAAVRVVPHG